MRKIYSLGMAMMMAVVFNVSALAQSTKYVKVKDAPEDWSGTYLIVYEDDANNQGLVFDGSLEDLDVVNNFFAVSNDYQKINGEDVRTIDSSEKVDGATFTISKSETEGIYNIVSASGCGIGYNKFDTDEQGNNIEEADMSCKNGKTYDNTIAMQEGKTNVVITAKVGYELRYNTDEGKTRFRYYAPGKKKAIKLYRKTVIEDEATAIKTLTKAETSASYTIQGMPVNKAVKGQIMISNGKKKVVK